MMSYIYSLFSSDEKKENNEKISNNWNNPEEQSIGNNWSVQQKIY